MKILTLTSAKAMRRYGRQVVVVTAYKAKKD